MLFSAQGIRKCLPPLRFAIAALIKHANGLKCIDLEPVPLLVRRQDALRKERCVGNDGHIENHSEHTILPFWRGRMQACLPEHG